MAYMKTRLPVELLLKYLFLSVSVNKVVDIVDEDICFADQSAVVKEFAGGFESFVQSTLENINNVWSSTYDPSELKFCKADKHKRK